MLAREWFSASELAAMALPGMPATERGVHMKAETSGWLQPQYQGVRWRKRAGRGGG